MGNTTGSAGDAAKDFEPRRNVNWSRHARTATSVLTQRYPRMLYTEVERRLMWSLLRSSARFFMSVGPAHGATKHGHRCLNSKGIAQPWLTCEAAPVLPPRPQLLAEQGIRKLGISRAQITMAAQTVNFRCRLQKACTFLKILGHAPRYVQTGQRTLLTCATCTELWFTSRLAQRTTADCAKSCKRRAAAKTHPSPKGHVPHEKLLLHCGHRRFGSILCCQWGE